MADDINIDIKLTGFAEFDELMTQLGNDFGYAESAKKVLVPAMRKAVQPIKDSILPLVPYDEKSKDYWHLRDSLIAYARQPKDTDKRSKYIHEDTAVVGIVSVKKNKVAISQEFGNARVPAKPYLRNGLARGSIKAINTFGKELGERIIKYRAKKSKG